MEHTNEGEAMGFEPSGDPISDAVARTPEEARDDEVLAGYYRDVLDLDNTDELIAEIVKRHRDYEGACKLAWTIYMAAMDVDKQSFRGIPGDGPEGAVRARVMEFKRLLHEAYSIMAQSDDMRVGPWVKRYVGITQGQIELSPPDRHQTKTVPGACGPECGGMHTYKGNCRMSRRTDS